MTRMRTQTRRAAAALILAAVLAGCGGAMESTTGGVPSDERPNIVLIVADDLGYGDIGPYGHPDGRTPHLDRMAAEGTRFTDFHANGPMCSPTRAALLTGLYQNRFGPAFEHALSAQRHRDLGLPAGVVTVAEALRAAGYATAMFGKWHLGYRAPHLPTNHGFDTFRGLLTGDGDHHAHLSRSGTPDWWRDDRLAPESGYTAELITRHSVDFIERNRDRPFFLYAAHLAIHFPWQGPDEAVHRVPGGDYWNLTKLGPHPEGEVGPVVRAMVEALDRSVGETLDTVRRLGLERKTVGVFVSDNGGYLDYDGRFRGEISDNGPLRGQKGDVFEGGHRVPAIVWGPGRIRSGATVYQTAMTMDLMPTILGWAGVRETPPTDGTSLAPLLETGAALPERALFWRAGDERAVRRGPWKLVALGEAPPLLFHLSDDVGETTDLAGRHPSQVRRLAEALARWEERVAP